MTTDDKGYLRGIGGEEYVLDHSDLGRGQVCVRKNKGWWSVFTPHYVDVLTSERFDRIERPKPCE